MPRYQARPAARSYGHAIGIIALDCVQPNVPGDVANASTYDYPVLYEAVEGLTTAAAKSGDRSVLASVVDAAVRLEARGVRAVTSNCGFLLRFQAEAAAAVRIPVALSSLVQVPAMLASLGPEADIGVITADEALFDAGLLELAAGAHAGRVRVAGMQDETEFRHGVRDQQGSLDPDRLCEETVAVSRRLVESHPAIRALLLECALLPPYSHAVQEATGLPVWDFVTLADWLFAGTHQASYAGLY